MRYQVQVRGPLNGDSGAWRPAISGVLNKTGRPDEEASTVRSQADASPLVARVLSAGAARSDVRVVEVWVPED